MTHRHLTAAAALAACTALLLTGCGDNDDGTSKDDDKIAGAEKGGVSPSTTSPSPSKDAERPDVELPQDVKLTFTPDETGDAAEDAVLRDNEQLIRALNAAIVASDPRLPALEFYTEGEAAAAAEDWVKSFADAGWTVTGTVRYYDRRVSIKSSTEASIAYCGDESKGFSKVIETGEVKKTEVSKDSYVSYGATLEMNDDGVWETVTMKSVRGGGTCQP